MNFDRLYTIIILSLLMVSCGEKPSSVPFSCDPSLLPYVEAFQSDSVALKGRRQNLNGLKVTFSEPYKLMNRNFAGLCTFKTDGTKLIEIEPIYWTTLTETAKTALVYHELGHCVLLREHRTDTFHHETHGNIYSSLMNPYSLVNEAFYRENKDFYTKELFR